MFCMRVNFCPLCVSVVLYMYIITTVRLAPEGLLALSTYKK